MKKLRIIVGGFIGLYPTGGVTWDYIQYVLGLQLLGHDVYYIEDTNQYPRFQTAGKAWDDASDSISYLRQTMDKFGLQHRWAYRDIAGGQCFGLSLSQLSKICKTADIFINISASTFLRDEYLAIPCRVLIDSDPMFTQIDYFNEMNNIDTDRYKMKFMVENHTHLFTFGEHMGKEDCKIPGFNFKWIPTRQPICMNFWTAHEPRMDQKVFTSVMNWSVKKASAFNNQEWGQKNVEFEKFITVPQLFPEAEFKLMITGIKAEKETEIKNAGWQILDPLQNITNAADYQSFINASTAEFSVSKETYVKSNSGWFSCRSACYLAAGKPVITEDTQWSRYIPSGIGLFAFTDLTSAIEALLEVTANTAKHAKAAREIAVAYFDSNKILNELLLQL